MQHPVEEFNDSPGKEKEGQNVALLDWKLNLQRSRRSLSEILREGSLKWFIPRESAKKDLVQLLRKEETASS